VDENDRNQAFEAARSLEQNGDLDGAAKAYARAGAPDDAVRLLMRLGRFTDGARYALSVLKVAPAEMGKLDASGRKLALRAAACLAQAGDSWKSAEILVALGDVARATEVLEKAGDREGLSRLQALVRSKASPGATPLSRTQTIREPAAAAGVQGARGLEAAGNLEQALRLYLAHKQWGDAARIARRMGKPAEAAKLYIDADMPFEAAVCLFEARDTGRCLEQLVRVPREHERYRSACAQAIRIANERDTLNFQVDRLLGRFRETGPQGEKELEPFYVMGRLYQRHGQLDVAAEAYSRVIEVDPGFRDTAKLLGELRQRGEQSLESRIKQEDARFRPQRARTPQIEPAELPPLPDLPSAPELPPRPMSFPPPSMPPPSMPPPALDRSTPRAYPAANRATPQATPLAAQGRASLLSPEPLRVAELPRGTLIAGRYEIEAKVGQGGMAAVYRAKDVELGEVIALKIFLQVQETTEMLTRFKQELLLSRQLAHPNVVRLYDIGIHEGSRFISMELLSGRDLGDIIHRLRGPMEPLRAIKYLVQVCAGLQAAHERGIIHRDIKPDNFFVTTDERVKVMDFGIAKRQNTVGVTQMNFLAGTPAYISPEQITGFTTVSHLADIYSLGVVAYELLTGTIPFDAPETMPLLMMHLNSRPPLLREYNPELSADLEAIVLKLLEKEPTSRYQNCRELARALTEVGQRLSAGRAP
jgi:tetratricopeptide (TPR) repeat protein